VLTSGQGTIQFVLRSGIDQQKVELPPTRLDQLLGSSTTPSILSPRPNPNQTGAPPPADCGSALAGETPKPPEAHILEMIQGTQRNIQKF